MTARKKATIGALLFGALALIAAGYFIGAQKALAPGEDGLWPSSPVLALPPDLELAEDDAARQTGLSGRPLIPDDYGMLFIFPEDGRHGFWMKDMLASIDIVWITKDGVIAYIEHDVAPSTYPQVFEPAVPVRYVLETRAGYAKERGWKEGRRFDVAQYAADGE